MDKNQIISPENLVYAKPELMNDNHMHYCPGCSHGVVHKLVAEVIQEMGLQEKTIGIAPVGCAVFAYNYIDIDWQEAAHGRAPRWHRQIAVAARYMGFTHQGVGDMAPSARQRPFTLPIRGEKHRSIYIINGITFEGRQMAPHYAERLEDFNQSAWAQYSDMGIPLKILDLLALLDGVCLATRVSVHTTAAVKKAKRMIRLAFENSMAGKGTSIVEVVSTCNAGWKMTPAAANDWMVENMFPIYPIGDLKNI